MLRSKARLVGLLAALTLIAGTTALAAPAQAAPPAAVVHVVAAPVQAAAVGVPAYSHYANCDYGIGCMWTGYATGSIFKMPISTYHMNQCYNLQSPWLQGVKSIQNGYGLYNGSPIFIHIFYQLNCQDQSVWTIQPDTYRDCNAVLTYSCNALESFKLETVS